MGIIEPGLNLYKMHEKYNTHSKHKICECGFVRSSFITPASFKRLPIQNLVGLALYGHKTFQALVFGFLAADSPDKFAKIKKKLKDHPILKQAEKDAEMNKEISQSLKNEIGKFKLDGLFDENRIFSTPLFSEKDKGWTTYYTNSCLKPPIYYSFKLIITRTSKFLGHINNINYKYKYYKLKRMGMKTGWMVAFKCLRETPKSYIYLENIQRRRKLKREVKK